MWLFKVKLFFVYEVKVLLLSGVYGLLKNIKLFFDVVWIVILKFVFVIILFCSYLYVFKILFLLNDFIFFLLLKGILNNFFEFIWYRLLK